MYTGPIILYAASQGLSSLGGPHSSLFKDFAIQDEYGRVRGWLRQRGPHNFINLRAPKGHNLALLIYYIIFCGNPM